MIHGVSVTPSPNNTFVFSHANLPYSLTTRGRLQLSDDGQNGRAIENCTKMSPTCPKDHKWRYNVVQICFNSETPVQIQGSNALYVDDLNIYLKLQFPSRNTITHI